jgi:hypothetical protein
MSTKLYAVMLCRISYYYAECHYAECHYGKCHYAEYHYDECHYAECHSVNLTVFDRIRTQSIPGVDTIKAFDAKFA